MSKISIKELSENNVHFGHKTSKYHPDMTPYIWGSKNKVHLIDLSKTAFLVEKACKTIEDLLSQGGQILWVGTKKQAKEAIKEAGEKLSSPYVINRWIGGTLTNFDQVKKAVTRLLHMNDVVAKPLPHYKKKEIVMFSKEAERLDKNVGGIVCLKGLPTVIVVVDAKREETVIKEASRSGVPVIGLVDTNTSTKNVDVVVPCNDDSPLSISLIIRTLAEAASAGIKKFKESEKGKEEERKAELAKSKASKPSLKPGAAKKAKPEQKKPALAKAEKPAVKKVEAKKEAVEKKAPAKKAEVKVAKKPMKKVAPKAADKKPAAKAEKAPAKKKAADTKK